MIPGRRKSLTAAQQYVNLKSNPLSAGAGELRAGRLHWLYETSPAPLSRSYGIRIEFANGGTPEVFVERPELVQLAGVASCLMSISRNPRACVSISRAPASGSSGCASIR